MYNACSISAVAVSHQPLQTRPCHFFPWPLSLGGTRVMVLQSAHLHVANAQRHPSDDEGPHISTRTLASPLLNAPDQMHIISANMLIARLCIMSHSLRLMIVLMYSELRYSPAFIARSSMDAACQSLNPSVERSC